MSSALTVVEMSGVEPLYFTLFLNAHELSSRAWGLAILYTLLRIIQPSFIFLWIFFSKA